MGGAGSRRNLDEMCFWDTQVTRGNGFRRCFYDEVNQHLWRLIESRAGSLCGRRVLFVGCGTSSAEAKLLASRGAEVWCLDISHESLRQLLRHPFGAARKVVFAVEADAEHMPFADGIFDLAVGKAIIHHLSIADFVKELRRVCVSDGLLVFSEPLGTNPLINLFRRLTPDSRVPTEHPLTMADVRLIAAECNGFFARYSFLLSLASVPCFFLGLPRIGHLVFRLGNTLDKVMFAICPSARSLAWNVTFDGRLISDRQAAGAGDDQNG